LLGLVLRTRVEDAPKDRVRLPVETGGAAAASIVTGTDVCAAELGSVNGVAVAAVRVADDAGSLGGAEAGGPCRSVAARDCR
jgi:hypothetical protein